MKSADEVATTGHFGAGMGVRNLLRLWHNDALLADMPAGHGHPDSASRAILIECWRRLRGDTSPPPWPAERAGRMGRRFARLEELGDDASRFEIPAFLRKPVPGDDKEEERR